MIKKKRNLTLESEKQGFKFQLVIYKMYIIQFSSVQSLNPVWLFATSWTTAHLASQSITNSRNPPRPMSIELVMPSNHFIFCRPLLLLPSIDRIEAAADSVSDDIPLPGWQTAAFLLCSHTAEGERELPGVSFLKVFYFVLKDSWLTLLWYVQMDSKGAQPHIYMYPFVFGLNFPSKE